MKQKRLYNTYCSRIIVLHEGEEFCEKCKGKGETVPKTGKGMFNKKRPLCCKRCGGSGKVDWVYKATGEDKKNNNERKDTP